MRVYLAGRYPNKNTIRFYAADLRAAGIACTSRWLQEPHEDEDEVPEDLLLEYAIRDLEDVDAADVLVQICDIHNPRGGAHVEFGYALKAGKKIIVVGPDHNIFHRLPAVKKFETWSDALSYLRGIAPEFSQRHRRT